MEKILSPRQNRRRVRLAELISEAGSATEFAAVVGTPKSHVSAILSGSRGLGDKLAAKMEKAFDKPEGWIDEASSQPTFWEQGAGIPMFDGPPPAHPSDNKIFDPKENDDVNTSQDLRQIKFDNLTLVQATGRKVPLISWVQAGMWAEIQDNFHPGEADEWISPEHSKPKGRAYALRVDGDSMTSSTPGAQSFPEGTIIIVDPDAECLPGSYVIAKDVVTQRATFKRLMQDGGRWFLRPLNPGYDTQEIDDPAIRVIGRVIEFRHPGGKL